MTKHRHPRPSGRLTGRWAWFRAQSRSDQKLIIAVVGLITIVVVGWFLAFIGLGDAPRPW
jgi:hypothetical protein